MLVIALIFPELLGTYGDGGNALVLCERARRRGIDVAVEHVALGDKLPTASLYLLGGGEDGPQRQATDALRSDGSLGSRIANGSALLAVCAGLQIVGRSFEVEGGLAYEGLSLVDLETRRGTARRVGELRSVVGDQVIVGFENHGGTTTLADVSPLGTVRSGFGNDGHVDGFRAERMWGTYAHGPVLAQNPWLADEILAETTGEVLSPLESVAERLYVQRLGAL